MLAEKLRECALKSLSKIAALLPPELERRGDHFPGQTAARRKKITHRPALEPGDFANRVRNERPVKLRSAIRPQCRNQSRFGLPRHYRPGKNRYGPAF